MENIFDGFAALAVRKPTRPIQVEPLKEICLHGSEDQAQYTSFLETMTDLAMELKFLSPDTTKKWQAAFGDQYQNIDFSLDASQWDFIKGAEGPGIDTADQSVLDDINAYFSDDWNAIKNIGGNQSYSQLAGGSISSLSDEEAFELMCSMLDSRQRAFGTMERIFGPAEGLNGSDAVINHISSFMSDYDKVDPHNLGILNMFFGMQTDFINEVDAYMNCTTYWGGDGTSNLLLGKVESYISTLSGDQKNAAIYLESMWKTELSDSYLATLSEDQKVTAQEQMSNWKAQEPAWAKVGMAWAKDAVLINGSWAKYFRDEMNRIGNQDAIRSIVSHILNRRADQKYKAAKEQYDKDLEQAIEDRVWLERMLAKRKKNMVKPKASPSHVSSSARTKAKKGPSVAARAPHAHAASVAAAMPKPKPVAAPKGAQVAAAAGMRTSTVAAPHMASTTARVKSNSATPTAAAQQTQAQKHEKERKII